jgi:hypothetical protein
VLKILGVAHPGEKTCGNRKESLDTASYKLYYVN